MKSKRKSSLIYLDGSLIKVDTRVLDAFTPGVFQGNGVFETILAIGDQIFDVSEHLSRLNKGFKEKVNLNKPIINQVVRGNGHPISRVRILAWKEGKQRHVMVMALNYQFANVKELTTCFIKTNRIPSAQRAYCKSLDYGLFTNAYHQAKDNGYDEAILINQDGFVFEASRANIFWIQDDVLYTPPLSSGCLAGITRSKIIKQARKLKIKFKEKNILPAQLIKADAIFLTNSLIGIQHIKTQIPTCP